MKRLIIAAVGLALVVGVLVGGMVGNPFDGKASASTAAIGGRLIELGTLTAVPASTVADYPMVDVQDCAVIAAMAQGSTTGVLGWTTSFASPDGTKRIYGIAFTSPASGVVDGLMTALATVDGRYRYIQPRVLNYDTTQDITA
jgi:hypothetical protein